MQSSCHPASGTIKMKKIFMQAEREGFLKKVGLGDKIYGE
jgi:hypothetical protein